MKKLSSERLTYVLTAIACLLTTGIAGGVTYLESNRQMKETKEQEQARAVIEKAKKRDETHEIEFDHFGDEGSLATLNGYNVALQKGSNYDENGQKIVDKDYTALVSDETLIDNQGYLEEGKTFKVILDHDYGTPAALPATHDSDEFWIKKGDTVTRYTKVAEVVTGNRDGADMLTLSGEDVRKESFLAKFSPNLDDMIMFITCKDDGRLDTIWVKSETTTTPGNKSNKYKTDR